jgi:hypothetical protein
MSGDFHLSLSIGKALWDDLVRAALPLQVADGAFELNKLLRKGAGQLQVRQRVTALLEDKAPSKGATKVRKRLGNYWDRVRPQLSTVFQEIVEITGDWRLEIDDRGTEFHYAPQKIGIDAHVKVVMDGKALFLKQNVELPFTLEKRIGASCHLGDIRFDKTQNSIVGSVQNPSIDLGEHVVLQLLNEMASKLLSQQTSRFASVPILPKSQLEEMVSPAGGPLKMSMGIDDVRIEVDKEAMTLKVTFGFSQPQLTTTGA